MAGTEMDMIGVSKFIDHFITMIFVQNIMPQIFEEGAQDDKGEMARMVSQIQKIYILSYFATQKLDRI